MKETFYSLIVAWNMSLKPIHQVKNEKAIEYKKFILEKESKTNATKVDSVNDNFIDLDLDKQMKYSSSMINNFDEIVTWGLSI